MIPSYLSFMMLLGTSPAMEAGHEAAAPEVAIEVRVLQAPVDYHRKLVIDVSGKEPNGPTYLNDSQLKLVMAAMAADKRVNVMQAPRITTLTGQKGNIEVGKLVQVGSDDLHQKVFMGLRFDVTPTLKSEDKSVDVRANLQLSEPLEFADGDEVDLPATRTLTISSSTNIPAGKTLLLAGGISESTERLEYTPPVLDVVPFIGPMFTKVANVRKQRQLLVLITPKVVNEVCSNTRPCVDATPATACPLAAVMPPMGRPGAVAGRCILECGERASPPECDWANTIYVKSTASVVSPQSRMMSMLDVLELSRHVSDEVIINQIRTTGATFTLGTHDLIQLSKERVSDSVIIAMQNTRPKVTTAMPACCPFGIELTAARTIAMEPRFATQFARLLIDTATDVVDGVVELVGTPGVDRAVFEVIPAPLTVDCDELRPAFRSERFWFEKQLAPTPLERIQGLDRPVSKSCDSDPNALMRQLLHLSEDWRQIRDEKSRFWFTNQPSTQEYDRLPGAIGP